MQGGGILDRHNDIGQCVTCLVTRGDQLDVVVGRPSLLRTDVGSGILRG
jgi:hypothetical protein